MRCGLRSPHSMTKSLPGCRVFFELALVLSARVAWLHPVEDQVDFYERPRNYQCCFRPQENDCFFLVSCFDVCRLPKKVDATAKKHSILEDYKPNTSTSTLTANSSCPNTHRNRPLSGCWMVRKKLLLYQSCMRVASHLILKHPGEDYRVPLMRAASIPPHDVPHSTYPIT